MVRVRTPKEILEKMQDEDLNILKTLSLRERVDMYNNKKMTNRKIRKIMSISKSENIDINSLFFDIPTYVKIPMVV